MFFEPASDPSRKAARRSLDRIAERKRDNSKDVPIDFARRALGTRPRNPVLPADAVLEAMKKTSVPMMHIGADHDISFPVENWYALNPHLRSMQLVTFSQAGHAPHHQYPEFVRT